jgi:hypothetical protein
MKNFILMAIMLAVGYFIWNKVKGNSNVINPVSTDNLSLDGQALLSVIQDEGINKTAPFQPSLVSPTIPAKVMQPQPFLDQPVAVSQITNLAQIQALAPKTVYATAKGSVVSAGGMQYVSSGLGYSGIIPDREYVITQNPTLDKLGAGQVYTPVSGGGYAIINQDEIPPEWNY